LLDALREIDDAPWADYGQWGLSASSLAKMLRPYSVKPKGHKGTVRRGNETGKGYQREWFGDAWERYCLSHPAKPDTSDTASQTPGFEFTGPGSNGVVCVGVSAVTLSEGTRESD
jgi:hypothetical protein